MINSNHSSLFSSDSYQSRNNSSSDSDSDSLIPIKTGLHYNNSTFSSQKDYQSALSDIHDESIHNYRFFLRDGTPVAIYLKHHGYSVPTKIKHRHIKLLNHNMMIIKFNNGLKLQKDLLNQWCSILKLPKK